MSVVLSSHGINKGTRRKTCLHSMKHVLPLYIRLSKGCLISCYFFSHIYAVYFDSSSCCILQQQRCVTACEEGSCQSKSLQYIILCLNADVNSEMLMYSTHVAGRTLDPRCSLKVLIISLAVL